jgi:hypothetical protein
MAGGVFSFFFFLWRKKKAKACVSFKIRYGQMPLAAPLTLHDLGHVPDLNDVNRLRVNAIAILHDDTKSVDEMRLADEQARNVLTDTLSRAEYLVQIVCSLPASEQALRKMTQVVLPGLVTGCASRFVVEILYAHLGRCVAHLPFVGLNQLVERICKILSATLVYARATGYISLCDLKFHTLHTLSPTCARVEDYHAVAIVIRILNTDERMDHMAAVWDTQIACEDQRHQEWIAQVTTLLLIHTPLPEVLVTLSAAYL